MAVGVQNFGGMSAYAASQGQRYQNAVKSGDTGLASRLQADAQRVGYSLPSMPTTTNQGNTTGMPANTTNGVSGIPSGGSVPPVGGVMKTGNASGGYGIPAGGSVPPPGGGSMSTGVINGSGYGIPGGTVPDWGAIMGNTQAQLQKQLDAQNAAAVAAKQAQTNNYVHGLQNSFQQNLGQIHDNQVLQDNQFNRLNNPFSGHTDYARGQLNRQREITNQNLTQDLNNRIAGAQQGVLDYSQTLAAQEPQQIQQEMHQQLQDSLALDNQRFNQNQTKYQNNYNAQVALGNVIDPNKQAIYNKMQQNSAAYATASPAEQIQLHNENMQLANQLGITYDSGMGTYTQPNLTSRTIAGQTLDRNNNLDAYKKAMDETNLTGKVTPALSALTGIAVGTSTQDARVKNVQLQIEQQKADTSAKNATTSANNNKLAQDKYSNQGKPTVDSVSKQIDSSTSIQKANGQLTVTDPTTIEQMILNSGLTPEEQVALYRKYLPQLMK